MEKMLLKNIFPSLPYFRKTGDQLISHAGCGETLGLAGEFLEDRVHAEGGLFLQNIDGDTFAKHEIQGSRMGQSNGDLDDHVHKMARLCRTIQPLRIVP